MEKYIKFMLGNNLVFIDSFQFMSSSFEKLVNNLPQDALKYTSNTFGKKTKYMTYKGIMITRIPLICLYLCFEGFLLCLQDKLDILKQSYTAQRKLHNFLNIWGKLL